MARRPPDDVEAKRRNATLRKRASRRERAAGFESYCLYLPTKKITAAVRVRNKLPENAMVTRAQIKRDLVDVIHWWAERWVRTGHE